MKEDSRNSIISVASDCCGCANCFHVCKKGAITMERNAEGFLYPNVNDDCVDCGTCLDICPQTKELQKSQVLSSYIAITKDADIKREAASGGVFGTIANFLLTSKSDFVCAASFVDGFVKHILTNIPSDIKKMQGSKYVQSELGSTFPLIKDILKERGNRVLFCGTPCQVAALYSYLKERPTNLYTLDLICHGVPSPTFFEKDIANYCGSQGKLKNVRFRWRNPLKKVAKSIYLLSVEQEKKTRMYSSGYDPYFSSFMRGDSFRYSCYKCHYSTLNRLGDITIGDCDSSGLFPDFHPNESKSSVIINTAQGESLWSNVKSLFDYEVLDLAKEAEFNVQLTQPVKMTQMRCQIYDDFAKMTFSQFRQKYASAKTKRQKLLFYIQTHFPYIYKWMILMLTK